MRNIIILGMHRSGTSMVAGALGRAGVYIGEHEELLVDQDDNPQGFWERRDVVELDDAILAARGGQWFNPPPATGGEGPGGAQGQPQGAGQDFSPAITGLIAQLSASSSPGSGQSASRSWLLKDPRMVLTLDAWLPALEQPVLLYVFREPRQVAVSLYRRNRFPLQLGLALWEHYNRRAILALAGTDFLAVDFTRIQASPESELARLRQQLAGLGVAIDTSEARVGYDPALNRSSRHNDLLAQAARLMTPGQLALEQAALALCESNTLQALPDPDPSLGSRMADLAAAVAPLADAYETRVALAEMSTLCDTRTQERDATLTQLKDVEDSHAALAQAHEKEVAKHQSLYASYLELSEKVADYDQLKVAHRALEDKAEHLFTVLTRVYDQLLDFESSHLAGLNRGLGRIYKLLTRRRGVSTRYEDALAEAREHFAEFQMEPPARPPGKLQQLGAVLRFIRENPTASLRSFSLARLRRGLSVLMSSSPEDFQNWVHSRFPGSDQQELAFDPGQLDAALDSRELSFPRFAAPRVSIVVPVYNDYRVTMNCLVSLLEHTPDIAYEVILADDCSTDLTASIAERVHNLVISRTPENARFLLNCNLAAQRARGEFILFLNNDTAVCAGWLDALLAVMDQHPRAGIVGPKLLFANGRLQEAGGIIWRDASGWNFGRADDPAKPEYNYLKPVDYLSGACLMIRAGLWRELGGFDERFRPAYYEDADIAFAVREKGYEVLYQPASQVFHFEGVSNGTDLNSGVKQHQVTNQQVFRDKWAAELERYHFPNAEHVCWARDRSRERRSILVIDHYVPHYDRDAGSRATFMYLQLMCELGYRVMFLGANFFPHMPYTKTLQQMGVEVLVGESMARNLPRWLQDNAPYIDAIYLHRPHVAEQLLPHLHKMDPRPPIIFFGHDLHYLRVEREHELTGDEALRRSAADWKRREYTVFDQVDKIYYPSPFEVATIAAERPDLDLRAIPLYVLEDRQVAAYRPEAVGDLLFVGGFNHPPNVDAVTWLVADILPLVRQRHPDIRLHIVGSNPTEVVKALRGERVIVHGYLSDEALDALYRRVGLAVVPLRYGAGVKGKVLEAIQQGVPLVCTRIGAEGIPEVEDVMTVADAAADLAHSICRIVEGDEALLAKLANYGHWLRTHFSKQRAADILLEDFGAPLRGRFERSIRR
ncbi:MAG: glycosyltransferase [Parahaliea sp.]